MPNKTIHFTRFTNGLYLASDLTEMPNGTTRRNRGIHPLFEGMFRTREGSTQLHAVNAAHSLVYFADAWYSAASTLFYGGANQLKSGLSGDRLSFASMPPVAGNVDYLFVAGGGELFKVSDHAYADETELITNGDMELDSNWADYGTPFENERSSVRAISDTYSRRFATTSGPNDGVQGDVFTTVSLAPYQCQCFVYPDHETFVRIRVRNGANDAWAYNVLHTGLTQDAWNEITFNYIEASGKGGAGAYIVFETDTSTNGIWYVDDVSLRLSYLTTDCGIEPPVGTVTLTEGAVGNLVNEYKYAFTFKNSVTGTRSNPRYAYDEDVRLLLHFEGADATTTFVESSSYAHATAAQGNAQIDTAYDKFGSASGYFPDGTGDFVKITNAPTLSPGDEPFCFDVWFRIADVSTYDTFPIFGWRGTGKPTLRCWIRIGAANYHYLYFDYNDGNTYRMSITVSSDGSPFFTANTFHHIAFIRGWGGDNNAFAITLDGVVKGTGSYSGSVLTDVADLAIGDNETGAGTSTFKGWLDEARYIIGKAGFTQAFTPPTVPYTQNSIDVTDKKVELTNIPTSDDAQVDATEIWRTAGDGTAYFLAAAIANGTTSYSDNIADASLASTELPTDNHKPYSWFDDVFGPYNASMFMLSRTQEGERGRLYYSAVGRTEAMEGFIEVAADDKGLQRGVIWQDTPFVFGEAGIYQIYGTNPYFSRRIAGAPGTIKPHTVAVTPVGIAYEAEDGVRLFNGAISVLISTENVQLLFRGKAAGALTAFSGDVAVYARNEYFISDEDQLLAFDMRRQAWRDAGDLAIKSLAYAKDADILGAGTSADGIYNLENEGDVDDNTNNISIDLETRHVRLGDDNGGFVKHIHIDHLTTNETLTIYLKHDGSETTLGTVSSAARTVTTLQANIDCLEFGVRITGSVDEIVKVYRISASVYEIAEELQ